MRRRQLQQAATSLSDWMFDLRPGFGTGSGTEFGTRCGTDSELIPGTVSGIAPHPANRRHPPARPPHPTRPAHVQRTSSARPAHVQRTSSARPARDRVSSWHAILRGSRDRLFSDLRHHPAQRPDAPQGCLVFIRPLRFNLRRHRNRNCHNFPQFVNLSL